MFRASHALLLWLLVVVSPFSLAQQAKVSDILATPSREGTDFASFGFAFNEFRSVELILVRVDEDTGGESRVTSSFPNTAQTYGIFGTVGTYISEYVRTELRYGTGIKSDIIEEALEVDFNYWFAWYMGASFPVTDYMSAYGLYGVSLYDADVTRRETEVTIGGNGSIPQTFVVRPSSELMEEDLFGTKFSTSWMLGLEFDFIRDWRLAFEYGRLLRDTDSNIKVYQGNMHLVFDF